MDTGVLSLYSQDRRRFINRWEFRQSKEVWITSLFALLLLLLQYRTAKSIRQYNVLGVYAENITSPGRTPMY